MLTVTYLVLALTALTVVGFPLVVFVRMVVTGSRVRSEIRSGMHDLRRDYWLHRHCEAHTCHH